VILNGIVSVIIYIPKTDQIQKIIAKMQKDKSSVTPEEEALLNYDDNS